MKGSLARFLLKITGWELVREVPKQKKYVGLVAPHTSNWDFIWGQLAIIGLGEKGHVLMKKELFFFPLGAILRAFGGRPVDRKKSGALVKQVLKYFEENEHFNLFLTPEGTRSKNHRWKTGFHYIARRANVPVYMAFIDYSTKRLGLYEKFELTDDARADVNKIKAYYSQFTPKFPEQFSTEPQ